MNDREERRADPWTLPLEKIADNARYWQTLGGRGLDNPGARHQYSAYLLEVLHARAVLEAAETQAETSRKLVRATWFLVGVTVALASAAIVALLTA